MVGVELEREGESANGRIATGRKKNVRVNWGDLPKYMPQEKLVA